MLKDVCSYLHSNGIYLTPSDIEVILPVTQQKILPKNTLLMQQGKVVRSLYFLNRGIVRLFRVHDATDHTLGFVSQGEFISTPLYLLNGIPSSCALEALTEIEVLEWTKQGVETIKEKVAKGYAIELAVMHRLLMWLQDAQIDAICLTAEERYQKMLAIYPEILQSVPLKYIASFLAIHQDSLSRIRKQLAQKTEVRF